MVTKVKMPKLTENDEEQVITAWLKKEGEVVRRGEPLVDITTSKDTFEFEAPRSGVLRAILADVNSSVPVGYVMALIGEAGDDLPDVSAANRKLKERQAREAKSAPPPAAQARGAEAGGPRATPAARRLARERGVDLAAVSAKFKVDVITESVLARYLEGKG